MERSEEQLPQAVLARVLNDPPFFVEHWPTRERPEPVHYLINSIFGAAPGEPFLFECLREATKLIEERSTKYDGVFATAGAGMMMRVMKWRMPEVSRLGVSYSPISGYLGREGAESASVI
jgi:hypothetical protein